MSRTIPALLRPGLLRQGLLAGSLLGTGCVSDLGTLSSLTQVYGDQTVGTITPPLRATMAVGALAAQLCVDEPTGGWDGLAPGDPPPVDDVLAEVLGADAAIEPVDATDSASFLLTGLRLLDQEDRRMILSVTEGSPFVVRATISSADGADQLGTVAIDVNGECSTSHARVSGTSSFTWADADHAFVFPTADSGTTALDFPTSGAWLPGSGNIGWQGHIDAQLRDWVSVDAAAIEPYGTGGLWTGTASGGATSKKVGWSIEVQAQLQP